MPATTNTAEQFFNNKVGANSRNKTLDDMREMTGRRKAFLNESEFLNNTKNESAPHSYSGKEELKEMTM